MATNPQQYINLAKNLPPRLIRFFARYPPPAILPQQSSLPSQTAPTSTTTFTSDPSSSSPTTLTTSSSATSLTTPSEELLSYPSPFRSQKHPITGKWHEPVFSLRRQAELVKLARQHGVEELLPHTVKGTEERIRKRMENGLRVKGTGVGQKVKGKESERTMKGRLEKRRKAMLEMPQMIQTWKERGHGRGWKKWPK